MSAAGPSNYSFFQIRKPKSGLEVRIEGKILGFNYYESLYSPMVTGSLVLEDTGGSVEDEKTGILGTIKDGMKISGFEEVSFQISTRYGELNFKNYPLIVTGSPSNFDLPNRQTILLNMVSKTKIDSSKKPLTRNYPEAPISDTVTKILNKELKISEDKLNIEKTKNQDKIKGNHLGALDCILKMCKKSIPAEGKDPGYFFFETQQGFRFKSIDSLIRNEPFDTKYTYAPGIIDSNDGSKDFKILEFSTSKNQNLLENLERGAYCSHRIYLNPLTFEYTAASQRIFKLDDYSGKIENLGEDIDVVLPSLSEKDSRTLASVPSRYVCGILDIGTTDTKVSELGNADPARIHSQSMMRYNTLFTQILTMTIPLNTNLMAGDILECEFPRIDVEDRKEPDQEQSGLYLIKKLTHFFNAEGSYTKLQLCRDTDGRKAK